MHEAFENDVARALDHGDKRMNTLTDEITAVKLEQAEFRLRWMPSSCRRLHRGGDDLPQAKPRPA